jgi:uncharacterized protein (DUF1697 family)
MRYIALLRGINVGGKNKVDMKVLKTCFETNGFTDVVSYINSGNIIFTYRETDKSELIKTCELIIEKQFGFHVVCCIVPGPELTLAVENAPSWWDASETYKHNAIFIIPPMTAQEVLSEINDRKLANDQASVYENIIFWSVPTENFDPSRYSKFVSFRTLSSVTVRNANTTKKLRDLLTDGGP